MAATPPITPIRTGRYGFPLLLALMAAGLAGNHFPFSILNAHFIFGSVFAMLAVQILGWGRGVAAAAIISGYTYLAWNHPWAFVTMTGEAAFVGWLFSRRRVALVTADAFYWIIIGIPLGYSCFHFLSGFPADSSLFLIAKQAFNGIANTLTARLIFTGFSRAFQEERISLRETLFNLLVFFVLLASLILVTHDARSDLAETDRDIRLTLTRNSRNMVDALQNWVAEREAAVVHLAQLAATLPPSEMQARLEQTDASDPGFVRMALLNREGTAVAYSPTLDELGRPNIGKSFADRPYLPLLRQSLKPMLSEVMPSRFGSTGSVAIVLAPVLTDGGYNGAVAGILDFARIRTILETHVIGRGSQYTLVDKNGNVILTNRRDQEVMKPFSMGKGSFEPLTGLHPKSLPPATPSKVSLGDAEESIRPWIPELPSGASTIDLWGKSMYVAESPIGALAEWKLILNQPVAPYQKRLYNEYSGKFFLLFGILLASLTLAAWVSRRTVAGIERLGLTTRNLPSRLESSEQIAWPSSAIRELHRLEDNIREMADSLRQRFTEIRSLNESLEQRVEEKTNALQETNRRLLVSQAQLIQAQKMESVGRLAGGVAHDFNNKLTVMMGYAQLAMEDLERGHPIHEKLRQVVKAGEQSVEIVRQLLAFARKQTISPRVLDLNETIEGMLKMLRRLIGEDIDLLWQPDTNLWPVKVDPIQIDQILANLCVNGRDAISGVGKVTIETENVVLDESYCADRAGFVPGAYVLMAVSDNGCGMDKETLANVFEPFFTTKEVGKGTGLGLSTVYGIVRQNNGFANVYSEPGKGTTFKIYLPRHSEKAEETPDAVRTEVPRGHGETILVVEDEASVLGLARIALENLGYGVLASATPAEAIVMAREHSGDIALLVTDVVLPGMSGKDLAGEISRIRPAIRTLYMSGYTANVIAHHGVLDEGVQFIGKPFTPDNLARKVREALETRNAEVGSRS